MEDLMDYCRNATYRRFTTAPVKIGSGPQRLARVAGGRVKRQHSRATIEGVAAVYYDGTPGTEFVIFPGLVERIMPGAFDGVVGNKSADVVALFNHDRNLLLGRKSAGTLRLESTPVGLEYTIEPAATSIAGDVLEHIRRRDVTGSSFSFEPVTEKWTKDTKRGLEIVEILDVAVFDVGPVTLPAYKATEAEVTEARAYLERAGLADRLTAIRVRASNL